MEPVEGIVCVPDIRVDRAAATKGRQKFLRRNGWEGKSEPGEVELTTCEDVPRSIDGP